MEQFIKKYNDLTPAQREQLFNGCDGHFTSDYAIRESGKTWVQLSAYVQRVMTQYHGSKQ